MQRPVDVVRDQFELANRGEFVAAGELFSEDVELVVPATQFLNGGVFHGRRSVWRWFNDWFRTFGRAHFELTEVFEAGDAVVTVARHSARGGASGVGAEVVLYYTHRVRDGEICHVEFHASRADALAAAGLPRESPDNLGGVTR